MWMSVEISVPNLTNLLQNLLLPLLRISSRIPQPSLHAFPFNFRNPTTLFACFSTEFCVKFICKSLWRFLSPHNSSSKDSPTSANFIRNPTNFFIAFPLHFAWNSSVIARNCGKYLSRELTGIVVGIHAECFFTCTPKTNEILTLHALSGTAEMDLFEERQFELFSGPVQHGIPLQSRVEKQNWTEYAKVWENQRRRRQRGRVGSGDGRWRARIVGVTCRERSLSVCHLDSRRRRHVANRSITPKGIFYFSFSMNFGAPMNIFFIIKVKILMFIDWSYIGLPNYVEYWA